MKLTERIKRALFPRLAGLEHEVAFWEVWFGRRGWKRPDIFERMINPESPLCEPLAALVDKIDAEEVSILDVGAGPITSIGFKHPRKTLKIKAVDALAPQYDRILHINGIKPIVRTQFAEGEHLTRHVKPRGYHLVCCFNALDHMRDPDRAVGEMIAACKPGGCVYLQHFVDEAEHEKYEGLHQWNLHAENGHLVIKGRRKKIILTEKHAAECDWNVAQAERTVTATGWRRI